MARIIDREDELWRLAYMENEGLGRNPDMSRLITNDPNFKRFHLEPEDAEDISGVGWELLGRVLVDNHHLETISISTNSHYFIDSDMCMLFRGLKNGARVKEFTLSGNEFGLNGIRSMVPFLSYSWNLTNLTLIGSHSHRINAECFAAVVDALRDGLIEVLSFSSCNLEDISALEAEWDSLPHLLALEDRDPERCKLPHLQTLDLDRNNVRNISSLEYYTQLQELYLEGNDIGNGGFIVISKLLRDEDSSLRVLSLNSTGMGDDEAEILASSLQFNNTLTDLSLLDNPFREKGCRAFMKLLNDISSISKTLNSNHSLSSLGLPFSTDQTFRNIKNHVDFSLRINEERGWYPTAAGRAKVIETQLNSNMRMDLSRQQGVDYCYSRVLSEIDPILFPDVFALVGDVHGHNEMYRMLLAMPELVANVDKKAVLVKETHKNRGQFHVVTERTEQDIAEIKYGEQGQMRRQIFPHRKISRLRKMKIWPR